jgi:endonuclease YncB( thermonuclease family)
LPAAPRQFAGIATPSGGVELQVGTTTVELFGVKQPGPGEHCGAGADSDCREAAQRALAKQLGSTGKVSCHVPNIRPGIVVAFAICLDATGVDLGGYLIGAGLALADTGQSYDYVGAESIARNLKQGLWHSR